MYQRRDRTGPRTSTVRALIRPEIKTAVATNCFVLALLSFEIGFGVLTPEPWWFLASAALACLAIWLGTPVIRGASAMLLSMALLSLTLLLGHAGAVTPAGTPPGQRLFELFGTK